MEDSVIRGIKYDKDQAKITIFGVPDKPGSASKIFGKIGANEINVDMIVQSIGRDQKANISFTVSKTDIKKALMSIEEIVMELGATEVLADEKVAKVSIVGVGMKSHSGVAARMFQALADKNINIQMISTSEIKISCIVDENDIESAVQAINNEFGLSFI